MQIIISPIEKIRRDGSVFLQTTVQTKNQQKCLWYSFDMSLDKYLTTENHDGFLVGLLLLAMKHGEDIYVKGRVSERLYYNRRFQVPSATVEEIELESGC